MKHLISYCLFLCLSISCSTDKNPQHDTSIDNFDTFCTAFKELSALPSYKEMSSEERHNTLLDIIEDKVPVQSGAYIAWDAIRYAEAEERYGLFTEAATASGYEGWHCGAMKSHAHEVGIK